MVPSLSDTTATWEPAGASKSPPCGEDTPLLVASSSRPPADASGGQEKGPLSPCKPWIEAQGEVPTKEAEGVRAPPLGSSDSRQQRAERGRVTGDR